MSSAISCRPPELAIHAATKAHVPVLAALHAACFAEPWDIAAIARILAMPGAVGLLAVDEAPTPDGTIGEPAGFALLRTAAGEAELLSIGIRPEARRRGAAAHLLTEACAAVAANGAQEIFLEVAADNAAGLALYEQAGFSRVGLRPDYYRRAGGARVDALILRRPLAT